MAVTAATAASAVAVTTTTTTTGAIDQQDSCTDRQNQERSCYHGHRRSPPGSANLGLLGQRAVRPRRSGYPGNLLVRACSRLGWRACDRGGGARPGLKELGGLHGRMTSVGAIDAVSVAIGRAKRSTQRASKCAAAGISVCWGLGQHFCENRISAIRQPRHPR